MRATLVLQILLTTIALALIYRVVSPAFGCRAAAFCVAVTCATLPFWFADGMESAAVVLMVVLLLTATVRADRSRSRVDFMLVGVASGLLVLSRLDFIIPLTLVGLPAMALRWRTWHSVGIASGATALIIAPHATWTLVRFGHLAPVSGTIKQGWISDWIAETYGGRFTVGYAESLAFATAKYLAAMSWETLWTPLALAFQLLAAVGVALAIRARRSGTLGHSRHANVLFGAGAIGTVLLTKAVLDLVFSPWWARTWYDAPQLLAAAVAGGLLAYKALEAISPTRYLGPLALALCTLTVATAISVKSPIEAPDRESWQGASAEAAEWMRTNGLPGIYGSPDSGVMGFIAGTEATVVNLDGLVNDFAYADRLHAKEGPLERYRSRGVRYFVARRAPDDRDSVPACASEIWNSSRDVVTSDGMDPPTLEYMPIRAWDLSTCP